MSYLEALQTTLAAEHATIYVLGYLGGQASRRTQPALATALGEAYAAHRARRDQLVSRVLDVGGTPVAADAVYALPVVDGPDAVAARAVVLEQACAATYDFLVASSPAVERPWAVSALVDSAVRSVGLGGPAQNFPGR